MLYFARHTVIRMSRVNNWSLHANIVSVFFDRVMLSKYKYTSTGYSNKVMLLFYLSYQVLPFYSILEICYVLSLDVEHYDRSCVSFLCIYNISGLGIQ